jgi:PAS domain S-box-containing protein
VAEEPFHSTDYFALFLGLFQHSSDAVYILGRDDGVILDANERFTSLVGSSREDMIGRQVNDLGILIDPTDLEAVSEELEAAGRVERRPIRFRNRWSEEFTVVLSFVVANWRGREVILGIGQLLPIPTREPVNG